MLTRIVFSDNATLVDFSTSLGNYHSGTHVMDYTVTDDFLFIGSLFPFNHFYMKFAAVNSVAAAITVNYWDGSDWQAVAEVIDETSLAGASQGRSGFVTFVPDKNKRWTEEDTIDSSGNERITGLGSLKIYDSYWLRVSFNATLTASTELSWVGPLFSNDDDLGSEYPDLLLSDTLTGFESGKTTWEEQHVRSAKLLIERLKNESKIISGGQIMDRDIFKTASISKVAEIAFNGMGDDFREKRDDAKSDYNERMKQSFLSLDRDLDGRLSENEARRITQGSILRR